MAREFNVATRAFRQEMNKATERVTGRRWCQLGQHFTDPIDGLWMRKRNTKMFVCAKCLERRRVAHVAVVE